MSAPNISHEQTDVDAEDLRRHTLECAILALPVPDHYVAGAVSLEIDCDGTANRINRLFEGRLYKRTWDRDSGHGFLWLADHSIPGHLVEDVLKTVAADRVLDLMCGPEADCAAARPAFDGPARRGALRDCPAGIDVPAARRIYAEAAEKLRASLDRDQLGVDIHEVF